MRSSFAALLLVFACEQRGAEPPPRTPPMPAIAPRPAPPPPPPGLPQPQPPPATVATFLHAHAADAAPWRVSYARGRVRKHLTPVHAAELARRLGMNESYVDGDYGCVGDPVDYVLARGSSTFAFIVDCGHMKIGEDDHAALFSPEMVTFLQRTRGDR